MRKFPVISARQTLWVFPGPPPKPYIPIPIRFYLVFLLLASPRILLAQFKTDSIEVSQIVYSKIIRQNILINTQEKSLPEDRIPFLVFKDTIPDYYRHRVPYLLTSQIIYLRFELQNSTDSDRQLYFFPGVYYKKLKLFTVNPEGSKASFQAVPEMAKSDSTYQEGFILIKVPRHRKQIYIIELDPVRALINNLYPRLINPDFFSGFKSTLTTPTSSIGVITNLLAGLMLMMIFYSFAVYLQNHNKEFLFYAGYAFLMGSLLFLKSLPFYNFSSFNYIFESFLDFLIQILGYLFYLEFIRKFLDTRKNYPFLEKLMKFGQALIIFQLALFFVCYYYFSSHYELIPLVENSIKLFLLLIGIIFSIYGFKQRNILMNYMVAGQVVLIIFSAFSLFLIISPHPLFKFKSGAFSIFNQSLLYYEIGLTAELVLFLSGLAYKNRKEIIEKVKESENLKLENERKEFEKQVAVLEAKQDERNRISADMHDELGSGVTAIRLMSEIVKAKMKEETLPEIEKISSSANDLINKMNTIIWTMISSNDTVESLVAYVRAYSVEFFENTHIDCRINISETILNAEMSGEKRRNIFLSIKEALNNIVKHAMATMVTISIEAKSSLTIEIKDNGKGIDLNHLRKFGNGISNMKKRIEGIGGEFHIENQSGTILRFIIKIN